MGTLGQPHRTLVHIWTGETKREGSGPLAWEVHPQGQGLRVEGILVPGGATPPTLSCPPTPLCSPRPSQPLCAPGFHQALSGWAGMAQSGLWSPPACTEGPASGTGQGAPPLGAFGHAHPTPPSPMSRAWPGGARPHCLWGQQGQVRTTDTVWLSAPAPRTCVPGAHCCFGHAPTVPPDEEADSSLPPAEPSKPPASRATLAKIPETPLPGVGAAQNHPCALSSDSHLRVCTEPPPHGCFCRAASHREGWGHPEVLGQVRSQPRTVPRGAPATWGVGHALESGAQHINKTKIAGASWRAVTGSWRCFPDSSCFPTGQVLLR